MMGSGVQITQAAPFSYFTEPSVFKEAKHTRFVSERAFDVVATQ